MYSKRVIFLFSILIFSACSILNPAKQLEKADRKFQERKFEEAIRLYRNYIRVNNAAEVGPVVRLADSYRLTNNFQEAESWYGRAMNYEDVRPIYKLYYAQTLQQNGKYKEAAKYFAEYDRIFPADSRGWRGLQSSELAENIRNQPQLFYINRLPERKRDYFDPGSAYYKEGIAFASDQETRANAEEALGLPQTSLLNIQESRENLGRRPWEYIKDPIKGTEDIEYRDGLITFSKDFREIFYTTINDEAIKERRKYGLDDRVVILKIMTSKFNDKEKKWEPAVNFPLNSPDYSVAHPSISADGKSLYFASNMPGGYGGMDIYVSNFVNGKWQIAQNLGRDVNTDGDEIFPYIASDNTLYFSSNAHPGLGGMDIFRAEWSKRKGQFSDVYNLGLPINSSMDDFAFIADKSSSNGFFTSNREEGDDHFYSFNSKYLMASIKTMDRYTDIPVKNVEVVLMENNKPIATAHTNYEGLASFEIGRNKTYEIRAAKDKYFSTTDQFESYGITGGGVVSVAIPMERTMVLTAKGLVKDKRNDKVIPEAEVKLVNLNTEEEWTFLSNEGGYYEFLLEPEQEYLLAARKEGYIFDEFKFDTKNRTESAGIRYDLAMTLLEEGVSYEISNIYYDYGSARLRADAMPAMESLLRILEENPKVSMAIASHTDSRGTAAYNQKLSQQRAQSVVDWLTAKGIAKSRLTAIGYGESRLLNECKDGMPCSDEKHEVNRRSEFTVKGLGDEVIKSSAPDNTTGQSTEK